MNPDRGGLLLYCQGIRRTAASPEPTDVMTAPFTESEADLVTGAAKRKRKRRRSPGGLGRGLARILTDSAAMQPKEDAPDSGLLQLVGGESSARAAKVRKFVVDTALATVADAFGLSGLILATTPVADGSGVIGEDTPPTFLAATLPPSWSSDSQLLFEIYGNLWRVLKDDDPESYNVPERAGMERLLQIRTTIDRHHVWMARMHDGEEPVAVVAIRSEPYSPPETEAMAAVLGSVVAACADGEPLQRFRRSIQAGTSVSLKSEGADVLAEVSADWELPSSAEDACAPPRRAGVGRATDHATAVARAAAKACRPRCEITFAGTSNLDGDQVSVVMIRDANHGLRLGFAVRPIGDFSGPAEAVFTAANPAGRI